MEPSVEWATRVPAARLRGLVDRYVGYRMVGLDPTTHRGLPSRHMTFIVSIGPPIDVPVQTNPLQPPGSYRCVLSGLQASSAQVSHDGTQEGVLIEMTPLGCRALLWMPAAVLWDQSFELSDVIGPVGDELWERLQPADRWSERFDVCDEVLLRRLDEQTVPRTLAQCWQGIVVSGGRMSVDRLATRAGYSRQHLTRLFPPRVRPRAEAGEPGGAFRGCPADDAHLAVGSFRGRGERMRVRRPRPNDARLRRAGGLYAGRAGGGERSNPSRRCTRREVMVNA